jgi:ribose 5-phosphate isomerase B
VKVAISSDHAGFFLKTILCKWLEAKGHVVIDVGTDSDKPVDYPDFAKKVADEIIKKTCEKGIIICGSGVGASIAANKVKGIRAAVCHDTYSARQGVEHDDMNVLVLGARIIGECLAEEIVGAFLKATFSKQERHQRRLEKIISLENSW